MWSHRSPRGPIDFRRGWKVIFLPIVIPAFLIAGALYLPIAYLRALRDRYRERKLLRQMQAAGRSISWGELAPHLDQLHGTLIHEYTISGWPGGYFRVWWTPDDIYSRCPHPWASLEAEVEDGTFFRAPDWCRDQYTSRHGTALLVAADANQIRSLFHSSKPFRHVPSHGMNWVDLCNITFMPRKIGLP